MIFSARQLQEKCQEQNRDLFLVFIDLTKAFYSVNRPGLWAVLSKIVKSFHDGMMATVLDSWLHVILVQCYLWYQTGLCTGTAPILYIFRHATTRGIPRL